MAAGPVPGGSRRAAILAAAVAGAAAVLLYLVLPRLAGLDATWRRVNDGAPQWLVAAAVFELLSFAGYVALFDAVLGGGRIRWRISVLTTLAGVAATRLLAAGGAGGIVLTGWVLRRAGRSTPDAAASLGAFLIVLYSVFMVALVIAGVGLGTGVLPGPAPPALTWLPAGIGLGVAAVALGLTPLRRLGAGTRMALDLARRRDRRLAGAVAWWGFDIAVLWACLEAFGDAPLAAPLVMSYFVGMLGNLLPLPGGVGGVDGAMIGALIAFGVEPGLAIVGVLSYRVFALWLPALAGILAYAELVRELRRWPATTSA